RHRPMVRSRPPLDRVGEHWRSSTPRHLPGSAQVYFDLDTAVLHPSQALCVALPAAGVPAVLLRLGGRSWALVAPASVVVSVVAITVASGRAHVLTWGGFPLGPWG